MHGAKVSGAGADHEALDDSFAFRFTALLASFPIGTMFVLKFTSFSIDISVVGH